MIARRLHPFEYQLYQAFAGKHETNIDAIFELPNEHTILVAVDNDAIVGSVHVDIKNKTALAINTEVFDEAVTMANNWCNDHQLSDVSYIVISLS